MEYSRIAALAAVGSVMFAGLSTQSGAEASTTPSYQRLTPATAPTATLTSKHIAAPAVLKSPALGNGTRNLAAYNKAPSDDRAAVGVVVVTADWADLEPTKGAYTTAPLDTQISAAAAKGLTVRLRVIAGTRAPAYAKKIGGAPIPFYDHQAKEASTIGRFWSNDYQARWQALMTRLAAKYDGADIVREVNISGTGTISAEVMLTMGRDTLPGSTVTNNDRLLAAGATESARRAALTKDIAFMQKTWAHTHTTLFCHPYVTIAPKPTTSLATTEAIVSTTYANAPGRTIFGHTGASEQTFEGLTHPAVLKMYQFFIANHLPYMAQTQGYGGGAKNEGVGDLAYVMHWLADHGAYSTELPAGWQFDTDALAALASTTDAMTASATLGSGG